MKPVLTKADFVRRYQIGEFGNRSKTWDTVEKFIESPDGHGVEGWNGPKLYHLRNRVKGGATYYNLTVNQLMQKLPDVEGKVEDYYVSEMAPHDCNLIQGEVQYNCGYILYFSRLPNLPMREALLKGGEQRFGLMAHGMLKFYMDHKSYEWLGYLFDTYPGHVIEFSTFSKCWGTIPGMNTVFWEVRKY